MLLPQRKYNTFIIVLLHTHRATLTRGSSSRNRVSQLFKTRRRHFIFLSGGLTERLDTRFDALFQ